MDLTNILHNNLHLKSIENTYAESTDDSTVKFVWELYFATIISKIYMKQCFIAIIEILFFINLFLLN